MKILHTSDIHLKEYNDDRWKTLLKIIELAKKENVDVIVISGDLFDKNSNAELLKNEVRKLFSNNKFKIILIAGNHDYKAFTKGVYFGKDAIFNKNCNSPAYSYNNTDIWTLSFEPVGETEVLKKLKAISRHVDSRKINVLLFHGELIDSFYSGSDYGEEGESSYMPVRLSYFEDLGFNYILSGHFHRNFEIKKPADNIYFVYSGSPISITKKEIGKRAVNLFEVGNPPEQYEIDTPYYELKEIIINPLDDKDPLSMIREKLKNIDPKSHLILKVKGYFDSKRIGYDEMDIYTKIEEIIPDNVEEKEIEINDIAEIIEDDLYKEFNEIIDSKNLKDADMKEINDLVVNALIKIRM